MSHHPSQRDPGSPDELDGFADQIDEQLAQSTAQLPGSSALDPTLWSRIRRDARVTRSQRSRLSRKTGGTTGMGIGQRTSARAPGAAPQTVPATHWHRGTAAFLVVATVMCIVMILPRNSVDLQYGARILEAPVAVSPEPEQALGCDVEPLTREEVLAIVLDPEGRGYGANRQLFATPPSGLSEYPHTRTWLPASNGTVEMAGGQRPVRLPTPTEFGGSKRSLDRYLRCQSEGSNFQLWALESPVEVQRQVLVLALAMHPEDPQAGSSAGVDGLTETRLLQTIDQVGPDLRSANNFNVYMFFHEEFQRFDVQSNPDRGAALVADNPETGEVEYAWIALQWVDPDTGELISTRGASLDATPASSDGTMPNLVVMILRLDAATGSWLVEWFVPTI